MTRPSYPVVRSLSPHAELPGQPDHATAGVLLPQSQRGECLGDCAVAVLAACGYPMAAPAVECPRRPISSADVAPVDAANTALVCRRSRKLRSGRF